MCIRDRGHDVNGDGKITNDIDTNGDGKVTLADWERGAYIVVNSWGEEWSNKGRVYLLYSAMIDPTWKRGNYLGRAEVTRHQPRTTLKLKLTCSDRTDLRMTIGIAGDKEATSPEHELAPEAFNGWPLFKGGNAGHVPLAGPGDETPLEVGIDLTSLLKNLGKDKGKIFLSLSRADGSEAQGELHECSIRSYGPNGSFLRESTIEIEAGEFGPSPLEIDTIIADSSGK